MEHKLTIAVLIAVFGAVVLFGTYQYEAHNRTCGLTLVLWSAVALVFAGAVLKYQPRFLGAWLAAATGLPLAYPVAWHLVRRKLGWTNISGRRVAAIGVVVTLWPLVLVPALFLTAHIWKGSNDFVISLVLPLVWTGTIPLTVFLANRLGNGASLGVRVVGVAVINASISAPYFIGMFWYFVFIVVVVFRQSLGG